MRKDTHPFVPLRVTSKNVFQLPGVYDAVVSFKEKLEEQTSVTSNFIQNFFFFFCKTMIMRLKMLLGVTQEQTN